MTAPNFCMLLRKHLASARLIDAVQPGLERVLILRFDCKNDFYEAEEKQLIIEIMGRASNLILTDGNGKIFDALRQTDLSSASPRRLLPGVTYELPPSQNKINILDDFSMPTPDGEERSDRFLFATGTFLGGAYEYLCSVFTEIVFGTVFWDYSWMPFNIGGRTNLLYMGFWGILSVVWMKLIYPKMSNLIEKLPALQGKIITWVLIGFMICNALLSGMAMIRYTERKEGLAAMNVVEEFLDSNYEDELIEKVWPNMVIR